LLSTEEIVGLGALGAVMVTGLCRRFWPSRVRHRLPGPRFAPDGVPSAPSPIPPAGADESPAESGLEDGPHPAPPPVREPYKPMIFAAPRQQMIDFLRVVFEEHDTIKLPACDWAGFYRDWATAHRMALMPDREFLTLLGKVEGAKKSRDRVKDRMGRVIHNEHGTPLRVTYYALFRPEVLAAAKVTTRRQRADAGGDRTRVAA
jgi:hypothetical protein